MPAAGAGCPLCPDEPADRDLLTIELVLDEDPVLGEWCPSCALPSGIRVVLITACEHGWKGGARMTIAWCLDCGAGDGAS